MKEKQRYHVWDIVNIVVFYTIFIAFITMDIWGIVDVCKGNLTAVKLVYRIVLTILLCMPFFIKRIFKVSFSRLVSIIYYLFVFVSGFLGVVLELYKYLEFWDIIVHFLMGVVIAIFSIFVLNHTVYKKDKKHNLGFTFIFMVAFTMAAGVVWEICEFCADLIFDSGFQRYMTYAGELLVGRAALFDTMIDLIMDTLGAIVGGLIVLITMRYNKNFVKKFRFKRLRPLEDEVEYIEE